MRASPRALLRGDDQTKKRYYALDLLDRLVDPGDDDEGAAAAAGGADEARARRRAPPTTRLGRGVDRYSVTHSLSFVPFSESASR